MTSRQRKKSQRNGKQGKPTDPSNLNQAKKNTENSCSAQQTNINVCRQHPTISINYPKQDDTFAITANSISRRGNRIQIISIGVNFGMLVATYFILSATRDAVNTSADTLKETQRQFAVVNQPRLQIDTVAFQSFLVNEPADILYTIRYYGNLPANLKRYYTGINFCLAKDFPNVAADPLKYMTYTNVKNTERDMLIAKESNDILVSYFNMPLFPERFEAIKNGSVIPLFYGHLRYTTTVDTLLHEYRFMVRFIYTARKETGEYKLGYSFMYNKPDVIIPPGE